MTSQLLRSTSLSVNPSENTNVEQEVDGRLTRIQACWRINPLRRMDSERTSWNPTSWSSLVTHSPGNDVTRVSIHSFPILQKLLPLSAVDDQSGKDGGWVGGN
uniref:Uncharacterized protein n=1 Tax=Rhodosorus marinus TaxID=101924 RepID=A0A7S2ZGH0_9RHOD|mmetsp:Transcript_18762/g.75362  ORF Transcript_18762/g.75362 Transcript_18762/m.75362 type:complete len:103 (+) Transcript_18762:164-472(+)